MDTGIFEQIVELIQDGIIIVNKAGEIQYMNHAAQKITEWEFNSGQQKQIHQVLRLVDERTQIRHKNYLEMVSETYPSYIFDNPTILITHAQAERQVECALTSKGEFIVIILKDITERRQFERELKTTLRLKSLGMLSSGIAHDFNNVLTSILGNISLAKLEMSEEKNSFKYLSEAEEGIDAARIMTQQLLTFSSGGPTNREHLRITNVIQDAVSLTLSGSNVTQELKIDADLWGISGDRGQLSQTIHNIVITSVHSMPIGGTIEISAQNVTYEEPFEGKIPPGVYVKLQFKDYGIGIPPDDLPHIFEPFYKSNYFSAGLEFSVVSDIVTQHEGYIKVESQLNEGTIVTLHFPAVKISEAPVAETPRLHAGPTGKILIMDDEEVIRKILQKMLTQLGYDPVVTVEGREALEVYQDYKQRGIPFDAIILDLTVRGGMGGEETIKQLLQIDPHVKAIASSGYTTDKIIMKYKDYGFTDTLIKPYKLSELQQKLLSVLKK